jgi:hypothetical protein
MCGTTAPRKMLIIHEHVESVLGALVVLYVLL